MDFTELKTEDERDEFVEELHLDRRKKSSYDYMFYKNLNLNPDSKKHQEAEYHYMNNKFYL